MPARVLAPRTVNESRYTDGRTADEITNFRVNDAGELEYDFAIMPLIPTEWSGAVPGPFADVRAIVYWLVDGEYPELLFLTGTGVFRYKPGTRDSAVPYPGLEEVFYYAPDTTTIDSVVPQGDAAYPAQVTQVGNRLFWTYCDGGGSWVYDGFRIRPFGFTSRPPPLDVEGPCRSTADSPNAGGFSYRGRIGTTENSWLNVTGDVVGGLDTGRWEYAQVVENEDGAFSETSGRDGAATHRIQLADPGATPPTFLEELKRKHRVKNIQTGGAAVVLLRTANLERLPQGDDGALHFLHRIPHGLADEWVDDIPDGELGPMWIDRQNVPRGWYFCFNFGGSTWYARTDGSPARVWWSEQESITGPTPESSIAGHWRDVYPSTGPITAHAGARLSGTQQVRQVRLIFKAEAVHYVTGAYPTWEFGTLDERAGCAGQGLVQTAPDGSVVWYGAGTFWRLSSDGNIEDIGGPVRRSCRRINRDLAGKVGKSWVDRSWGEVVFVLPYKSGTTATRQFVYDWRAKGMRFAENLSIDAVCVLNNEELTIVAGTYGGSTNVYLLGRGHAQYDFGEAPAAIFRSGWFPLTEPGDPGMHAHWMADQLILSGEERSEATVSVTTMTDWNPEATETPGVFHLAHPDNDDIPFYDEGATNPAVYGTSVWRTVRPYTERLGSSGSDHSYEVLSVELTTTQPFAFAALTVYGNVIAVPGARNPQSNQET